VTRGDIYLASLDPVVSGEANTRRSCIVVSNDANNRSAPTVTVVPITSNVTRSYPFEVVIEHALAAPDALQSVQYLPHGHLFVSIAATSNKSDCAHDGSNDHGWVKQVRIPHALASS